MDTPFSDFDMLNMLSCNEILDSIGPPANLTCTELIDTLGLNLECNEVVEKENSKPKRKYGGEKEKENKKSKKSRFYDIQSEAEYRLDSSNTDRISQMVYLTYSRYGNNWVPRETLIQIAIEVGYGMSNNIISKKNTWHFKNSLCGERSVNSGEPFGRFFPYWTERCSKSRVGSKIVKLCELQLSDHFFGGTSYTPEVPFYSGIMASNNIVDESSAPVFPSVDYFEFHDYMALDYHQTEYQMEEPISDIFEENREFASRFAVMELVPCEDPAELSSLEVKTEVKQDVLLSELTSLPAEFDYTVIFLIFLIIFFNMFNRNHFLNVSCPNF